MKHLPFLILLFLFSCSQHKAPEPSTVNVPLPEYIPKADRALPDPVVTDTVYRTQRVEVPVMWSWQDDSTQARQIVQPGANLEAGNINLSGMIGPYKFTMTGTITLPIDVTVTPNEPEDTTNSGNDPPVVVDPSGNNFLYGVNSFPWVPLEKYSSIGLNAVRFYVPWHWIGSPGGKLFVQPMKQAWTNECHGIDNLLQKCKSLNIDPLLTLNQCPEWLRPEGSGMGGGDYPPAPKGANLLDTSAYKEYGDFVFQIVARYGSSVWPKSALRVDTVQQYNNQPKNQPLSGLKLIKRIQIGNEVDNWFSGFNSDKYMDAKEHCTMLYVAYKAAKKADPSIIVVMAGLTDWNLWYLKEMKAYADSKGWAFPCDIIDCHHYSNVRNRPGTDKPTWDESGACYPNDDPAFSQIVQIVAWAKSIGKDVFVTEFGADTNAPSQMRINGSRYGLIDQAAQGQLIVKTLDALKAAGVKGGYIYNGIDADSGSDGGLFESSGIYGSKAAGYPEKAAVQILKQYLQQFKGENK